MEMVKLCVTFTAPLEAPSSGSVVFAPGSFALRPDAPFPSGLKKRVFRVNIRGMRPASYGSLRFHLLLAKEK